jgi:hypothetical protein
MRAIIAICILALTPTGIFAQNWPQFRGPTGDGQTSDMAPAPAGRSQ